MTQRVFFLIIFIVAAAGTDMATASPAELPFYIGEKITFEVRWSNILAGETTLQVMSVAKIADQDSMHILLTARTSELADIFYKVRDVIESYVDMNMNHSLAFIQSHKARTGKDSRVDFDWGKSQAECFRLDSDSKTVLLPVPEGAFDPLSVFYAFRLYDLKENEEIRLPVTDGRKVINGRAKVVRRERIQVAGCDLDTFLVEPELEGIGGVFEKSREARLQIWVTADRRHIPVRIKSKVAVGSFTAEITSYDEGAGREKRILESEQILNPGW